MTRPASDPSSGGPAAAAAGAPRVLAVTADGGALHNVRQWTAELAARIEWVPRRPHAARQLAKGRWHAVVVALRDRPEDGLPWWVAGVHAAPGRPRPSALV